MKQIDELSIDTIRFLAVDAVERAQSGHPGLPMGGAAMTYTLWARYLKHNPANPGWPDRDRFVLSAGHGSMLLYGLLHLFGYDVSMEDLKAFRQWGSKTPGHPEYGHTPGVETTTGPLGQGFANAVGMALAERRLAATFNRPGYPLVDHYTYVYSGDGCMMEGITAEAASLAGHLGLGRLICLYDDNEITIDGSTEITFTENVAKRFEAYGWQVLKVEEGQNMEAVCRALEEAKRDTERPSLLMVRTEIGYGSPNKGGQAAVHGAPLGEEEVKLTKKNLDWPPEKTFYVPQEVQEHMASLKKMYQDEEKRWQDMFSHYKKEYPELADTWEVWHRKELPSELRNDLEELDWNGAQATRASSGRIMQILSHHLDNLCGGSADLNASTKTYLKDKGDFQKENREGNNIFFGVREHAMAGICNGMALHGGLRPYCSTFLVFSDYMKPALRMAALSKIPMIFVFTHDSIGVGEDGPTHQPMEHLAMLRALPHLEVHRPADGRETAAAWYRALERRDGPTAIVLSRQGLPALQDSSFAAGQGAYILQKEKGSKPELILLASGSEVELVVKAAEVLREEGKDPRVVSVMSWEAFFAQEKTYQEEILPKEVEKRLVVEAAHPMGWEALAGNRGRILGLKTFGASAPGNTMMENMGFSLDRVVEEARSLMEE